MQNRYAWLAAALLALVMAGCHGGSTPTEGLTGSFKFSFSTVMSNTSGVASIEHAQSFVDNVPVADSCPPQNQESEYDANGNVVSILCTAPKLATVTFSAAKQIGTGNHTLRFVISQQTTDRSPSPYKVSAFNLLVTDANGKFVKTISMQTQTAGLAAGQAIVYTFTI
jgi:hypothetical protein